ncbi:MAG: hypothetical protein A2033_19770 [Bacteroidetes bacterium GWA2_31_9]|nr:MAG: hypothetical protein A2033_19770 [Bacteroidetes bacterium GWA2_31_9]
MELHEKFKKVYNNYCKERMIEMGEAPFASIITTFPSLLIAMADGKADNNEKLSLVNISKSLAESFKDEQTNDELIELLSYQYYAEFDYLLKNTEKWESAFIELLSDYLKENPENKTIINDMIIDVANASNDICDAEQQVVSELENKLNLK